MFSRIARASGAAVLAAATIAATAQAAGAPPLPKSHTGHPVTLLASGLGTPTSFAAAGGNIFEGDGGSKEKGVPNGGVFLLKGGSATKLAGSPNFVGGLAYSKGTLYVSAATITKQGPKFQILAWSKWNGTAFASQKAIWTAPKGLDGLNGIAVHGGKIFVGVDVGLTDNNDHGPATTSPDLYDILTMSTAGKGVSVFASGIRQPWQFAFPAHSSAPLVSDLGQDKGAKNPPDYILRVHKGDDYGFPTCNGLSASACKGDTKPFKSFAPHTDIMGLAIVGQTLYMTSFDGIGGKGGGEVLSMPVAGGKVKPVVTGFVAPIVGLGANGKQLLIGETTGQAFSVGL